MARRRYNFASLRIARCALLLASSATALLAATPQAWAQCNTVGTNQTCTNPAGTVIDRNIFGIQDTNVLTLTNYGSIIGEFAVYARSADVTNHGVIRGDFGIITHGSSLTTRVANSGSIYGLNWGIESFNNIDVNNSGSITSDSVGITAINTLTLNNSGTISGLGYGITAGEANVVNTGYIFGGRFYGLVTLQGNINNAGTIAGATGVGLGISTGTVLTNSGTIIGTGGTAIDFSRSTSSTLNLLAGSRIIGRILLGAGDVVNVQAVPAGNSMLTISPTGAFTLNVSGNRYTLANGTQVATLDPTAFGMTDRTLMDFSGNISSLLGSRFGDFGSAGSSASAFAPSTGAVASGAEAAFGNIPSIANAYARERGIPNATAVDQASGLAVWSKAFAGWRRQDGDEALLASSTTAYGAALGMDKQVRPDLRLGFFLGAGNGRLNVDADIQSVKTDYLFGGVYGRLDRAAHFFDFALAAGHTANSSERTIANNLAPGGFEKSKASYDGWFLQPEIAYGMRMPLAGNLTLTPTARLRYLAGFFDGYSETGSSQNLSVSGRTTQNVEERFELALSRPETFRQSVLHTTVRLGVLGTQRVGGSAVNTILIGQNLAFGAPGRSTVFGGYTGVSFDYRVSQTVKLFTAAEVTVMSDKSRSATIQGGISVAF